MKEINGYLLVDCPEDGVKEFSVHHDHLWYMSKENYYSTESDIENKISLPKGNYSIIGLAKDLTEEQWKGVVEHRYEYGNSKSKGVLITKDYVGGKALETFTESGHSLLKVNNLNSNTTLILKKIL